MKKFNTKLSQRFYDHLIQAVLIFASVFLAFWLNEYRISLNKQSDADEAINAVLNETENNLQILERWTPYHSQIIGKLKPIMETQLDTISQFTLVSIIDNQKGIFREILTNNAWHFINQSDVKVNISDKLRIAQIYEQQKYVTEAMKNVAEFLGQREILRDELVQENYIVFARLILELQAQESAMIQRYKGLIKELNQKK